MKDTAPRLSKVPLAPDHQHQTVTTQEDIRGHRRRQPDTTGTIVLGDVRLTTRRNDIRVDTKARRPRPPSPAHNVAPDSDPQRSATRSSRPATTTARQAASGQRQPRARAGNGRWPAAVPERRSPAMPTPLPWPHTHVDRQRPRVDGGLGAHGRLEPQLQLLAHLGARGRRTMLGGRLGEGRGRRREARRADAADAGWTAEDRRPGLRLGRRSRAAPGSPLCRSHRPGASSAAAILGRREEKAQ